MKFASCFVAIIIFGPLVVTSQKDKVSQGTPGLHDKLLKAVQDTASYLGFGITCLNGGHKTDDNVCLCARNFKGRECETRICINGGKLEKVTIPNVHHICKCPYPEFIAGEHCEKIRCAKSGILVTNKINATWHCDCQGSRFYSGQFCEKFAVSSGWIMAIACFGVFVIVVFICSSNWFSRNRAHRRYPVNRCPPPPSHQSSGHRHSSSALRDASGRRIVQSSHNPRGAHRSASSDDLISSERGAHRRTQAFPTGGITGQYVVRLDTIPTFNPTMIGGVEPIIQSDQPVGPPPSYDQAMSSIRADPPVYTPTDASKIDA